MIDKSYKSIGRWLKYYWKDVLVWIITIIGAIVLFAFGFFLCFILARDEIIYLESMVESPDPEVCVLCRNGEGAKIHAPCIVNLSTGEVAELSVYEAHPTEPGEVSAELKKGYFSFFGGAGAQIMCNPDSEFCRATLPKDSGKLDPSYFCYECRRNIAELDKDGYVIADMYDPENVSIYKIWNGAKYEIREYLLTVNKTESRNLEIEVHGLLDQNE